MKYSKLFLISFKINLLYQLKIQKKNKKNIILTHPNMMIGNPFDCTDV